MKALKRNIIVCVACMVMCAALLIGTTFAWFTDDITNKGNVITAGNLDIEATAYKTAETGTEIDIDGFGKLYFATEGQNMKEKTDPIIKNEGFEPGKSDAVMVKLKNTGSLDAKVKLYFDITDSGLDGALWFDFIEIGADNTVKGEFTKRSIDTLPALADRNVKTLKKDESVRYIFVYGMYEEADSYYEGKEFSMDVTILATQANEDAEFSKTITEDDLAAGGTITLGSDASIDFSKIHTLEKDVTLDLGGHELSVENTSTLSTKGATLTVKNGNIKDDFYGTGNKYAMFGASEGGKIVLENLDIDAERSIALIGSDGTSNDGTDCEIVIKDCKMIANDSACVSTNATKQDYECKISISDSMLKCVNENGDNCPVFVNVPCELSISDCEIYGDRQGVMVRSGSATISDTTIYASGECSGCEYYLDKEWKGGNEVPMAALVVGNRGGGTAYNYAPAKVTLNNCTIELGDSADKNAKLIYAWGNSKIDGVDGATGGATIVIDASLYKSIKDNCEFNTNSDVEITVTANNGKSLNDSEGCTDVLLTDDIELTISGYADVAEYWNGTVNIDMNGKSVKLLSSSNGNIFYAMGVQGANVTISGNGTIDASQSGKYALVMYGVSEGTLTIKDGTYIGETSAIQLGNTGNAKQTCIIEGGFFKATGENSSKYLLNCIDALYDNRNAKFIVKGGTFVNFNPAESYSEDDEILVNWVADGYKVIEEKQDNGDIWYKVVKE